MPEDPRVGLPFESLLEDNFGGVTIDVDAEDAMDTEAFYARLSSHLVIFTNQEKGGIWLRLPLGVSHFVAAATALGFEYHHAKSDYLMLTKWLPTDRPSTLPQQPHTQVGGQVLVVQEKFGFARFWKLPGGLTDSGEDLADAAVREVLEETGIVCEFRCIAAFREHHGAAHGATDLYTVCCCVLDEDSYGGEQSPAPILQAAEDLTEFLSADGYSNGSMLGIHMHTAAAVCKEVLWEEAITPLHGRDWHDGTNGVVRTQAQQHTTSAGLALTEAVAGFSKAIFSKAIFRRTTMMNLMPKLTEYVLLKTLDFASRHRRINTIYTTLARHRNKKF